MTSIEKVQAALEVAKSIAQEFEMVREYQQFKEALRELDGKVLVPVEPTQAMYNKWMGSAIAWDKRYAAMIAPYVKGE